MKAAVKREGGLMHPVILGSLGCRKGLSVRHHNLLSLGPCPPAPRSSATAAAVQEGEVCGVARSFSPQQTSTFYSPPPLHGG